MNDSSILKASRKNLLSTLVSISKSLASERHPDRLLERIIEESKRITNSDGGTFYLLKGVGHNAKLHFEILHNDTLRIKMGGTSGVEIPFAPVPLYDTAEKPNKKNVASYTALEVKTVNVVDAYESFLFDFSGTKAFDKKTGYRSQSILAVPLLDHDNGVLGVIQLLNARDEYGRVTAFDPEFVPIVESLASYAAISLENHLLLKEQKDLLISLSAEPDTPSLLERILFEAQSLTHADGGTLYLLKEDNNRPRLEFAIMKNNTLNISKGGNSGEEIQIPPIYLYSDEGVPNHKNIATHTALAKKIINVEDAYNYLDLDFTGVKKFDEANGYSSKSFLTVPLLNHASEVIGVIQLVNSLHPETNLPVAFNQNVEAIIEALASYAAIALDNEILLQAHKDLLEAFIKCIAKAIDAKSPHTSGHCQRVPELTELIARAACDDQESFKDFLLDKEEWYELQVASWLHDCGKLATPDSLLDKSTKLHLFRDGIEEIKLRLEVKKKDLQIDYLLKSKNSPNDEERLRQEYEAEASAIDEIREFVQKSNTGGEFMAPEKQERIKEIAKIKWRDVNGDEKDLLTEDEIINLCISRGTLTAAERQLINNHMVVTIDMLESLPFPKNLRKVPEYAGGHHEKMDGTGFPKGLTRAQMSIPARMMAIADIFEALTSKDRPYKKPMPISVALNILKKMKEDNHIDPDLYYLFVRHKVWVKYGEKFLNPDQLDVMDVEPYLK